MQSPPGVNYDETESTTEEAYESKTCGDCGADLEWTLDLDGVQRLECPNCDD